MLSAGWLGVAWFQYAHPDYGLRTLASTVPELAFDAYALLACLRARAGRAQRTLRVLGVLVFALMVSNMIKGVQALASNQTSVFEANLPTVQFFVFSLLYCIVTLALFVLLAAQDLQEKLDQDLQQRIEAEKSMELAAQVYAHTSEGMMVTTADGTIQTVNPAFSAMTGYSPEELVDQSPRILKSGRQNADFYADLWNQLQSTGSWVGEMWDRRKNGEFFAARVSISTIRDAHQGAQRRVALFHDITQNKRAEELIYRQAHYDTLTGIANRNLFYQHLTTELSRSQRHGTRLAVLSMDLDRFKPVNDIYGHEAGDWVLKEVAQRWQRVVRASDTLARVGGDEFALLAVGLSANEDAHALAAKLAAALQDPVVIPSGAHCSVGCSIGVAFYPDSAQELKTLMAAADSAMYASKRRGDGQGESGPVSAGNTNQKSEATDRGSESR